MQTEICSFRQAMQRGRELKISNERREKNGLDVQLNITATDLWSSAAAKLTNAYKEISNNLVMQVMALLKWNKFVFTIKCLVREIGASTATR